MKMAVLLLFAMSVHAQQEPESERLGIVEKGACLPSNGIGYRIVQRFDDHNYELSSNGPLFGPHALLRTKEAIYDQTGIPVGIGMRRTGVKQLKLENGFIAQYLVWEECFFDAVLECKGGFAGPGHSWPRRRKNANCKTEVPAPSPVVRKPSKPTKSASCQEVCFERQDAKKFKKGETLESCLAESCK